MAGHLNHGIRGAEADADEAFCVDLCRSLGVPFVMGKADVPDEATKTGESLEMAARRLRRAFLAGAAVSAGASAVALAHTLDDQLELFLLRLARGAGLRGLAGMPAVAPFDRASPGVRLAAEGPPWAPGDPARDLAGGPAPVARRRVARALYDAGADPESVSFAAVERVRALAAAGRNGTVPLGGSLRAKLDYGALSFDAANSRPAPGPAGTPFVFPALSDVPPCGATPDPERRLRVERSDKLERPPRGSFVGNPDPASVRAGALDGRRVVLRPWRAGDRIAVAGGRGTRKLSDIFTDAKLPRDFRARVVVLADAGTGEVLWLPGHGVSRELAVRPGDAILRLVLSRR